MFKNLLKKKLELIYSLFLEILFDSRFLHTKGRILFQINFWEKKIVL